MRVRIEIDTKTFVRFWLVVIGFAFAILAIYLAQTALIMIGTAGFLALALNGPVNAIVERLPNRSRTLSTALAFISIVALLGVVLVLVVPPIVQQTSKFVDALPGMVHTAGEQWHSFGAFAEQYHIQAQVDQVVESARSSVESWTRGLSGNLLAGISSVFSAVGSGFLVLVLTFLMLTEGPAWAERFWGFYRDQSTMERHQKVAHRMHAVVAGYVTGQLTISGIGALFAGAAVFVLSLFFSAIPSNLALVTIAVTFVLALIPMFGATIAGVMISLLLAFNALPGGLIFAAFFIIYQQIENNFISPTIQSRKIDLTPLVVLVAITIGLYIFGIIGGLISIPIAGCCKVLLDDYLEHNARAREDSTKPLAKLVEKIKGES